MDEDRTRPETAENSELIEWQTPELIVEEIEATTRGGTIGDVDPVDDAWYS